VPDVVTNARTYTSTYADTNTSTYTSAYTSTHTSTYADTNTSTYTPFLARLNDVRGELARINLQAGTAVDLNFQFVDEANNASTN